MVVRVYLAGPEVFLANAREMLDKKAALAREAGFEPVSPGDLGFPARSTLRETGLAISALDEQMMLSADAIIANLTPFRGIAADSGTVFELGFMCGRGKAAFGFSNVAANHYERTMAHYGGQIERDAQGHERGPDGLLLENFELHENLMLDGGILSRNGALIVRDVPEELRWTDTSAFEECLRFAAGQLLGR